MRANSTSRFWPPLRFPARSLTSLSRPNSARISRALPSSDFEGEPRPDQASPEGLSFWVPSSQENVLQNGKTGPFSGRLEGADQSEAGDTVRRQALDRGAFEENRTRVGELEPRYEIDRRALASAVGADQPGHLALLSAE